MLCWVVHFVVIMAHFFFLQATINPMKTSRGLLRTGLLRRQITSVPVPTVPVLRIDSSLSSNRSYLIPLSMPIWSGSLSDLKPLIIHEDEHIIVVYKPPSFLIQSEAIAGNTTTISGAVSSSTDNNLFDAVLQYLTSSSQPTESSSKHGGHGSTSGSTNGQSPLLYLLHRLDRPCSGVVVFAKTKTVSYTLHFQFSQTFYQCTV